MKTYWDTSAILYCLHAGDQDLLLDGDNDQRLTRPHTLSEMFSTLTGGKFLRKYSPEEAAQLIRGVATRFTFIECSRDDTLAAINETKRLQVYGAKVHDLMHIKAAQLGGAARIFTLNAKHFTPISNGLQAAEPA